MEISGVGMRSATPGITFSTISHPNAIKTMNSTNSNTGSVCHSKFVPFIVAVALIMVITMRMSFITATITWSTIPLLLRLSLVLWNAGLVMGFLTMIKTMISTTIDQCTKTTIDNPSVGGCKVVVKIISITENLIDFSRSRFRKRRTMEGGSNWQAGGEVIDSLLS